MNIFRFALLAFALSGLLSCGDDSDDYATLSSEQLDQELQRLIDVYSNGEGNAFFVLPESGDYTAIPQDPLNPITRAKVDLGKLLLHETAMGGNPKMQDRKFQYACATCHPVASGFGPGRRQGIGEGGIGFGLAGEGRLADISMPLDSLDVQPVRPPSLLNLAYQDVMLWDRRFGGTGTNSGTEIGWHLAPENFEGFQGIEVQAMQGQEEHRLLVNTDFVNAYNYKNLFDAAFSDIPETERYTKRTAAFALAAYNRTLLTNEAPWQDYLKGNLEAMSKQEKRGAIVFMDAGKCIQCHTGPALKDRSFHAFGFGDFDNTPDAIVKPDVDMSFVEKGRGSFTQNPEDDYKFKTPTLYNLVDTQFFGHGATFSSIRDVIQYKNEGTPQNANVPQEALSEFFGNLDLSDEQMADLERFLETSLRDTNLERYVPSTVNSGFCFPANDVQSQADLECN